MNTLTAYHMSYCISYIVGYILYIDVYMHILCLLSNYYSYAVHLINIKNNMHRLIVIGSDLTRDFIR